MATLRNMQKLAAILREIHQKHPRNGQLRNTSIPRISENYITEVFEEIERRATKKPSRALSKTESQILSALSELDELLLNTQIWKLSGNVLATFWTTDAENQEQTGDRSQSDPHPKVDLSICRSSILIDSDLGETSQR